MGNIRRYVPAIVCLLIAVSYAVASQSYSRALFFAGVAVLAAGATYWRQRRGRRPVTTTYVLTYGILFWILTVVLVVLAVLGGASARPFFIIAAICFGTIGVASVLAYLKLKRADAEPERSQESRLG